MEGVMWLLEIDILKNGDFWILCQEKNKYILKAEIIMKKFIVLVLCVAVLICSIACLPAIDAEAAKKFGTHTFECRDQYQSLVFSNTLSANLYFEDCPTKWVKKKADYEADVRVHTSDMISYSAYHNLYCDTSGNISYASDLFQIYGSSK